MKAFHQFLKSGLRPALALLALTFGSTLLAQSSGSDVPVVTIQATTPTASGPGSPGVFTVFRAGSTNVTLNVFYAIGGTASNGMDYAEISNWVLIPAGSTANTITLTPLTGLPPASIGKMVVLALTNSPMMTPVNYSIGTPSLATVDILPPPPPWVTLVTPTNGQVFYTPVTVPLMAKPYDPNGTVTNVEFFAGTNDLGPGHPVVIDPLAGGGGITGLVYLGDWVNAPAGQFALTAVAADSDGVTATSAPVKITILTGPPPTNLPPVVRITSPPNGSVFRAPVNLPLYAYAADPDGSVTAVEFFAGTTDLGAGRLVTAVPPPLPPGQVQPAILLVASNYWELVWTNAPLGTNVALTAEATDNAGTSTISAPVFISVLPSPPPPTNRPAIVSVVATDPVAIEGTNCWTWPGLTNSPPTWSNWVSASAVRLPRFTNCGPKNATFTVFRWGATNNDLNVNYTLGGTASNGVDYVALPDSVTVPAGESRALVNIVPIDDGPPDVNKTVVLTLAPTTNTPVDYLIGLPRRAAAIILDSAGPWPVSGLLPDRCFHLVAPGPDTAWFAIEWSADLFNWQPVCTNQVVNGSIDFVDPEAPGSPGRFYRAVPLAGPPAQ